MLAACWTLLGFGVSVIGNLASAQDSNPNTKGGAAQMVPPPEPVRIALLAKATDQALELLQKLDAEQPEKADQWSFYSAVALQDAERYAEANQTLSALIEKHPKSVWMQKALYRRAEVCQRLGLFDEAEAIYREAASRLRSKDRQSELAELYLKLAEQLTQVDEANPNAKAPRYAEALGLYQKVLDLEVHVAIRARVLMQMGHCSIGLNQSVNAAQYFQRVGQLELPAEEPMRWEAVRAMGRQWIAGQRYSEALRSMEDFLRDAQTITIDPAKHAEAKDALERAKASAYRVLGDAWLGQHRLPLALSSWRKGLETFPADPERAEILQTIALALQNAARTDEAVAAWEELARSEPNSAQADRKRWESLKREAQFSKAVTQSNALRFDEALLSFREYVRLFPNGEKWSDAQTRIVDLEHSIAYRFQEEKQWEEARRAMSAFVLAHPLDSRVQQTQLDLALSYQKEGLAGETPNLDLVRRTVQELGKVAQTYPQSNIASQALFLAAQAQELHLADMVAAVAGYKQVRFGSHQSLALAALERLTRTELTIRTERIVRTGEAAQIKVQLRNVPTLDVQIYPLNLESYYRKHHTYKGVENLDLDLIAPDQRLEHKIADYEEYAPIEFDFDLPIEGPGVWAIAVASETHRATTLVIRSDIDMVVKTSAREAFVYAQNMLTGQPAEGVRVLMTHGQGETQELLEWVTDKQGVARWQAPEDQPLNSQVHVLASIGGHIAATDLDPSNWQRAPGFAPRSLIYADRPAYQPGESLRWRAIVRTAEDGLWKVPTGEVCQVDLLDSQGLVVAKTEVALGDFGTCAGRFTLPPTASPGQWTLVARTKSTDAVRAMVRVEPFRLPRAEVVLSTESTVIWRGDKVQVKALAQTTYGAPLANVPLRWSYAGKEENALTGPDGTALIEFETREYASDQNVLVGVNLPTENVSSSLLLFVSTRGFYPSVSVPRAVELVGSSFPVTVKASTPDGEGAQRTLRLQAFRRMSQAGGRWSEDILFERELQTDAQGQVTFPISIQQSGLIYLRVRGTDRFENTVEAETSLTVSGEDDKIQLRLLAEETQVSPGQSVTLQAINRSQAGIALLTLETDRVVEHSLVTLRPGVNAVPVRPTAAVAPNVRVALAFMDGHRFHEAETFLEVIQPLQIRFQEPTQAVLPGTPQILTIEVTNAQGLPVQTELSLAAVDEALYALYPDQTPHLDRHFRPAARNFPLVRTESSCHFAYTGQTQAIALSILDERKREEREKNWRAQREDVRDKLERQSAVPVELASRAGRLLQDMEVAEEVSFDSIIGVGGGAGGRFGGRKSLQAAGGRSAQEKSSPPDAALAFWKADLVTDEAGKATVTIAWPERSTRWRLTAHGVGRDNHFGSATTTQTVQADFFVEIEAPQRIVEGDQPRLSVQIHDAARLGGKAQVELFVNGAQGEQRLQKQVQLDPAAVTRVTFDALQPALAGQDLQAEVRLTLQREGITLEDQAHARLQVREAGMEVFDQVTGVLTDLETVTLNLAGTQRVVELHFGPHLSQTLMQAALGESPRPYRCLWGFGPAEMASDLMGALALTSRAEFNAGHPRYADLTARIRSLIGSLSSGQRQDGGWNWQGSHGDRDGYTTAHVALALGLAKSAGWDVEDRIVQAALNALHAEARAAGADSDELKAHLHHALAALGQADFAALNRLHRAQAQLSIAGKAHLALALHSAGRQSMGEEITRWLTEQASRSALPGAPVWSLDANHPWYGSPLEVNAWAVIAIQTLAGDGTQTAEAGRFLVNQFSNADRKAAGLLVWALAQQVAGPEEVSGSGLVTVTLAGASPERIPISSSPGEAGRVLAIPLPDAAPGSAAAKIELKLQLEGNLRPTFQVLGKAFQPAVKSETAPGFYVRYQRLLPDVPRYLGRAMQTGFHTVRQPDTWINTREQVRKGEVVRLELRAQRYNTRDKLRNERHDYLELEVPLPAGLEVLETGPASERQYRRVGNSLVFPLGALRGSFNTTLELVGVHAGEYQFPPAILRSVYRPELTYVYETERIRVLTADETPTDEYRATPDERYFLGKAQYEHKDLQGARDTLLPLINEYESQLEPYALVDTARILLFAGIEHGDDSEIVRFFEIIKERDAQLFVPIEQVLRIGDAYSKLGEHERAMLIFRATLEETFGSDLKLVAALDENQQWLSGTRMLSDLVNAYPDLPVVRETDLAICDRLLQMAPQAEEHDALRAEGIGRATLTGMGIQRLRRFLALHGQSSLGGDAGLNLVSAFFDLEDHASTAQLCEEFAARFPLPRYRDAFRYSQAVASWYLGQDESALEGLLEVASTTYEGPNGRSEPSKNRSLAYYIAAQIHHAQQNVSGAEKYYAMISKEFPDARYALQTLQSKELRFVEKVFRTQPGTLPELLLEHRNLAEVELLAFPVDLMTLYLREKDLSRVTEVNLAGISPTLSTQIQTQNPSALRTTKQTARLQLTEPGAYLVMARGESEHASCLVLVSHLDVHVQEFDDGQVRVQVMDANDGQYLREVDIRVIGSGNQTFQVGKTDPRGLFVASGVIGRSTVIARLDNKYYAFHLGTREMGTPSRQAPGGQPAQVGQSFYLQNVIDWNDENLQERGKALNKEMQADRKGVQVLKVK